ncbi:MAG: c-type cytochrome [Deltaproteobacteria bacterium]|nr:c-type cytochrome [Deltaproteobacteria bacterium]
MIRFFSQALVCGALAVSLSCGTNTLRKEIPTKNNADEPGPFQPCCAPDPTTGTRATENLSGAGVLGQATPVSAIKAPPGFQVELVYSAPRETQGSWISIAVDNQDRLIASAQHETGLFRITPAPIGAPASETRVEKLKVPVGHAHGLLYAHNSLYVVVGDAKNDAPYGNGVYRLRDTNHDDQYDAVTRLVSFKHGGEHGPHGLALSPDGKWIYFIGSNFTDMPDTVTTALAPKVFGLDQLLPPVADPTGNKGRFRPGGWVVRFTPDGSHWELVATGVRNAYDLAFNNQGDLFTYDSDMEWDLGTSWYRSPRICMVPSGAEFGWRNNTAIWPDTFADSVGALLDTGPASPSGVVFGYQTHFPTRYRNAFFALDWTYGTIHAVTLTPKGSAYEATKEDFIVGAPLPVADIVVRKDGALYFITGGRQVQSGVYRVTYTGIATEDTEIAARPTHPEAVHLRELRHQLETYHGHADPKGLMLAWPYLGHPDRFLRSAARLVIEHQPVQTWRKKATTEKDPWSRISAIVALSRHGKPTDQKDAIKALTLIDFGALSPAERLEILRALSLVFIRLGKPTPGQSSAVIAQVDKYFPSNDKQVDAELSRMLAYLNAPSVVEKTIALMESAEKEDVSGLQEQAQRNEFYGQVVKTMVQQSPHRQRMLLASMLRNVSAGWTTPLRKRYFQLINEAMSSSRGGNLYYAGWKMIREESVASIPEAEKTKLAGLISDESLPDLQGMELPSAVGPGQEWSVRAVMEPLGNKPELLRKRNFENGRKMFSASTCVLCHRFNLEGGNVGPDLAGIGSRFSISELMESIVNPASVVSDQYASSIITLKNGEVVTGRIIQQDDEQIALMPNMFKPQELKAVPMAEVATFERSPMSQMPPGLINGLNLDELLDLLAYLLAGANPRHVYFN